MSVKPSRKSSRRAITIGHGLTVIAASAQFTGAHTGSGVGVSIGAVSVVKYVDGVGLGLSVGVGLGVAVGLGLGAGGSTGRGLGGRTGGGGGGALVGIGTVGPV